MEDALIDQAPEVHKPLIVALVRALKACRLSRPHPLTAANSTEAHKAQDLLVRGYFLPRAEERVKLIRRLAGGNAVHARRSTQTMR